MSVRNIKDNQDIDVTHSPYVIMSIAGGVLGWNLLKMEQSKPPTKINWYATKRSALRAAAIAKDTDRLKESPFGVDMIT